MRTIIPAPTERFHVVTPMTPHRDLRRLRDSATTTIRELFAFLSIIVLLLGVSAIGIMLKATPV